MTDCEWCLKVLRRSGTAKQRRYAARIQPVGHECKCAMPQIKQYVNRSLTHGFWAGKVVQRPHWTLVTLLLCNAAALEVGMACRGSSQNLGYLCRADLTSPLQALPIFLDRIVDPIIAIVLSVTAVLLFGETISLSHLVQV